MVTSGRNHRPPATVSALLLAAGTGERLGGVSKAFVRVDGNTLLEHDVAFVGAHADEIIVGARAQDVAAAAALTGDPRVRVVAGGPQRLDTLRAVLGEARGDIVLVWDVARTGVGHDLIRALVEAAREHGAAIPAVGIRLRESIGLARDGFLAEVFPRDGLVLTQTPQAYARALLEASLARAHAEEWPDIAVHAIVRRCGHPVRLVRGDPENRKITFPEDLDALLDGPPAPGNA